MNFKEKKNYQEEKAKKAKTRQKAKNQKGITLVALVVTIVVLIILATVSINAVMGENGIIRRAQIAGEMQANAEKADEQALDSLLDKIGKSLDDVVSVPKFDKTVTDGKAAMTPVKWNGSNWVKTTEEDEEWYNYKRKQWANVVLGDATFNEDGTLNEDIDKPYTQLVWIPRFAYKITSMYHTASTGAGNIEIVFIDTNNKDKNGEEYTRDTKEEYPTATIGGGMSDYVVHPAFDYGGTKAEGGTPLEGFWMGKYESSHTGCDTTKASGEETYSTDLVMCVRANVTSWRNLTIGDAFSTCLAMNSANNPYGLNTDDSKVDPHMTKNSEWGAVAYLSQSQYGKNEEVWNNSNKSYITGIAGSNVDATNEATTKNAYNTEKGQEASTTGNVYGIYDMSGGAWEKAAAYVNNGHDNLTTNGGALTASDTASRYRDVYTVEKQWTSETLDTQEGNYALSTQENGKYGDAVYETSNSPTGTSSWYSDFSLFPYSNIPFFARDGGYGNAAYTGVFGFGRHTGEGGTNLGFRVVVPVLQ